MQILSIHLKNIKAHRALDLEFSPGINVLAGPNGVGKSTIFEAIGYALFGVDAQSFVGNVERFITIGARKGEISVVFATDGERFRVSRTVGTPSRWLLARQVADGFEVEEHKDLKETEARLKELLGLDNGRSLAEQFELVIGPFQNEFLGPFVIRQPARRRDKFDEILGIDSWRRTFNETKVLAAVIKAKVEALQSAIAPLMDQVAALPDKRAQHKTAQGELDQTAKAFQEQEKALQDLEIRLLELDRREQTLKELAARIDEWQVRIANGRERIASQNTLITEAEQADRIVSANAAGRQAYEEAEQRLLGLREQLKVQRRLEREQAALDNRMSTLAERCTAEARAIEQAARELATAERELADKRKALAVDDELQQLNARLPQIREALKLARARAGQLDGRRAGLAEGREKLAEGVCPFFREPCLNIAEKPPGDVFSDKFAALEVERDRLTAELSRLERQEGEAARASEQLMTYAVQLAGLDEQATKLAAKRKADGVRTAGLAELKQEQAALQQQLAAQQLCLQAYGGLQADIETAEAQQQQQRQASDLYVANREQAAKLAERRLGLLKFEQLLAQLQGELVDQQAALAAAGRDYDADSHQQLREQQGDLGREVGALGQKVEGLKAEVLRLAGEIDRLKEVAREITARQAQIKAYGEQEDLVKYLRNRVFRNVSGYLSTRYREEISQRANRIYRIIAEVDEELAWGEDYRLVLRDMVDGELRERADDQLSGGQTMSAVVALRLAMLQTIGARIAFFDEPTSNLDATRRENLAHAFRAIDVGKEEVTEHWYDQLFLISHDVAFTEVTDQIVTLHPGDGSRPD